MLRLHGLSALPGLTGRAGRLLSLVTVILLLVSVLTVSSVRAIPQTDAPEFQAQSPVQAMQECADVVVLTATGDERGREFLPTRYSSESIRLSNGHEDRTVRAFLQKTEELYRARHNGDSLMADVHVVGFEPRHYPSESPNSASDGVMHTLLLASRLAHPLVAAVATSVEDFHGDGTGDRADGNLAVREYEAATGCRPQYILVGAAEGATLLAGQERALAERGQLAGALYLGPQEPTGQEGPETGFPAMVGQLLRPLARSESEPVTTKNRLNYCLPGDGFCELSRMKGDPAEAQRLREQGYARWDTAGDRQVMEAFASWVDEARH